MGAQLIKMQRSRDARRRFENINQKRDAYLIVHYSCESFYDIKDGRTPRITSIAIRNFASGQTHSFSIHKCAEQSGVSAADIPNDYDKLERMMLDEYFVFVRSQGGFNFIHWNMRDNNFGFQAIEHRLKVLKGDPFVIDDARKFDMAKELIAIYGPGYAPHGEHGRLFSLMDLNKITAKDAMNGKEEARAFDDNQFVALHQSTLRKVDVMSNILERVLDGSLKTAATWWEARGLHPVAIVELAKEHWLWTFFALLFGAIGIVSSIKGLL
ncbi:hypothetical protein [Paraburkholderia caffeinilytica]|uniref:Uncharacterized protein n=1 Tax=Paraburkholderia caffeinilytica TaxID=1761016 RepID=A0ABQ1NBZ7_9BURK|nr:hypothetical protein [Paraburkholderia caffeinilytica]GGC57489.1 hypothetical protein GCM10011400_51440 [Paraburkholderia caffeinilytica]CAB3804820.1 hypothetical protein LMG28690_06084 [Paraburkholderia caffeinilytica]